MPSIKTIIYDTPTQFSQPVYNATLALVSAAVANHGAGPEEIVIGIHPRGVDKLTLFAFTEEDAKHIVEGIERCRQLRNLQKEQDKTPAQQRPTPSVN